MKRLDSLEECEDIIPVASEDLLEKLNELDEEEKTQLLVKVIQDNTEISEALLDSLKEVEEINNNMTALQYHIEEQRESNEIIRDCVMKFPNETSLTGLVNQLSEYILYYYRPSSLVLYMSDDFLDDETYKPFSHLYEYHSSEGRVATNYKTILPILEINLKAPQQIRHLTKVDLKRLTNNPNSAILCKLKTANSVVGFILLEFEKTDYILNYTLLSSIVEIFTNSYGVLAMTSRLALKYQTAFKNSYIDVKTNSFNSRKFNEDISSLNKPYCIIAMDIDNFKRVNDTYGHDAGDMVIAYVVQTLNKNLEMVGGKAYREGGDEFLGLTTSPLEEVEKILQDTLTEIREHQFAGNGGETYSITNSAGLYYNECGDTPEVSKKKADILLYMSKENGKARYTIQQDITI